METPQKLPLSHPQIDAALERRAGDLAMRFHRPRQREFALAACARHRYAVDYLEQAPILLVAIAAQAGRRLALATRAPSASGDTPPLFGRAHEQALGEWNKICQIGWRLPKVMAHYKIAPPFRALHPGACTSLAWWPVRIMTRQLAATAIAQAIPPKVTGQQRWLKAQAAWYRRMFERGRGLANQGLDHPLAYTRWAAVAFGRGPHNTSSTLHAVADVADFAVAAGVAFNTRWNLLQADEAACRWHEDLTREREGEFKVDPTIDYAPFPDVFRASDGLEVVALRTRRALFEEGQRMKHCVVDYHAQVVLGTSRIFSIRRVGGEQLATIELTSEHVGWDPPVMLPANPLDVDGLTPVVYAPPRHVVRWILAQAQGRRAHHADPRPPLPGEAKTALRDFCVAYRIDGAYSVAHSNPPRMADADRVALIQGLGSLPPGGPLPPGAGPEL